MLVHPVYATQFSTEALKVGKLCPDPSSSQCVSLTNCNRLRLCGGCNEGLIVQCI